MKQRQIDAYRQSEETLLKKFSLDRKEHFIPVNGHGTRVRVQETGSGDPLLLIHGGPNAGSTWLDLASRLPSVRCLIPRLPGSVSSSEKTMKEIGHGYSIERGRIADFFMEWYVSLWNNTDTIKNDFDLISKVVRKGQQNPEFVLHDHEIEKLGSRSLWLWGKDDAFAGSEVARRITGKMQHATLIEFDNSGHLPWLDNPGDHAGLIREFLFDT
jgi:pimeloyl-ACP methyl ester carboxylesterase